MPDLQNEIQFDAEDKKLSDILMGEYKYKIPRYQRPYSWTEDEVSDLWNDLINNDASFIGSFIFNYEYFGRDKTVEIIDGQQRIITFTIIMAVIRDFYKHLDVKKANLTQSQIIVFNDPISGDPIFRLKCSETLDNFFREYVQEYDTKIEECTTKRKEEKNVVYNYSFLKKQIESELENLNENSKKIQFLDDLKRKIFGLRIIWIRIDREEDAYTIFETVNARGEALTTADLLKNFLLQKIQPDRFDEIDTAKESWASIVNNIENADGPLTLSKFIRYYWLSRYSFVSEKRLYKEIKIKISDPEDLLNHLIKASEYYYKIANSTIPIEEWNNEFPDRRTSLKIFESLKGLRLMKITQCYSLLFCLLMNKNKIGFDFSNLFKVIEKYHFAYSAVCKLPGNVVEKLYYKTANNIQESFQLDPQKRKDVIRKILEDFTRKLKDQYPSKELFIEKFMDIDYRNPTLVVYILANIEKSKSKTDEIDYLKYTKINIEHILPQDPSEWSLAKNEVKDYVNILGNLTLIDRKINGSMQNKKLKDKLTEFSNSKLTINKELLNKFEKSNYAWDEKEIKTYQKELAEYAYNLVWKI
ncbi:MAG: DUF262 domain-containing HNH endonuclease family protein [bacterium]|nr:DUF262 domain-containing HNH endonuclease family protein [bacterium]